MNPTLLKRSIRNVLRRFGIDLSDYPLFHYLRRYPPKIALDVGANVGGFGRELRRLGFRGEIHSFEPHSGAFRELQGAAVHDSRWVCHNFGLGEHETTATLHIAHESVFNSLLSPLRTGSSSDESSASASEEEVRVRTLDQFINENRLDSARTFLKVDTQGYELNVLKGGAAALKLIQAVQLELSLRPLYEGQPTMETVVAFMHRSGFGIFGVWPGLRDQDSRRL